MRRRRTGALLVTGVALAAGLVSGCGIRTTSVPVDAGAAPTRVPCNVTGSSEPAAQGVQLRVYLLCGAQLERVDRRSPLPEEKAVGDPVRTASALLAQLEGEPSEEERQAGFATAVKGPLAVTAGHRGDPKDTLRLSRQPEDLPPTALAQVVCTFAESAAGAGDDTVVLGGPGAYEPRRYRCTQELKERPDSTVPTVPVASAPVSAPPAP
ncbi:lipoprotein [Streptomyces showdoensis]|uniref:Lipoprotein n=1 Tax=Streptomyces showdoensis TaxID=68268 RepID=A0A2P2GMX2_STREW|nr:lipoprotein [Streptomyces showdoensis]KKZ72851.1 lipoprotein [Streptomyces showdoensis]